MLNRVPLVSRRPDPRSAYAIFNPRPGPGSRAGWNYDILTVQNRIRESRPSAAARRPGSPAVGDIPSERINRNFYPSKGGLAAKPVQIVSIQEKMP